MRRDVYQAISDPVRRDILGLVSRKPRTVNAIAEYFDVSRPAISRHIRVLNECGLLKFRQEGREHYCEARFNDLKKVMNWSGRLYDAWEASAKPAAKQGPKKAAKKKAPAGRRKKRR